MTDTPAPGPALSAVSGTAPAPTLLDALTTDGRKLKDEGMRAAEHGEDARIRSAIEAEVRRLAARRVEFTPDEVLPGLTSRKAVGPVFSRLARESVIVCVGYGPSTAPSRRHGLTRRWVGTGEGRA